MLSEKQILYQKEKLNWYTAETFCVSQRGHLASIHSQLENEEVNGWWMYYCELAWLGGRPTFDGDWQWTDNSTWEFESWLATPSKKENQTCTLVMIYNARG